MILIAGLMEMKKRTDSQYFNTVCVNCEVMLAHHHRPVRVPGCTCAAASRPQDDSLCCHFLGAELSGAHLLVSVASRRVSGLGVPVPAACLKNGLAGRELLLTPPAC